MCIMAMAWAAHPRWRLVLIGNRDEYHARPAAPLAPWPDRPGVIAGRDLQSGGTWLGVSTAGRAVIVTNLRGHGDRAADRASRGALVADLLAGDGSYADAPPSALDDFNPFNLILIDGQTAQFLTNRPAPARTPLAPGLHGLSNGPLDAPWPKTLALKAALDDWLTTGAQDPSTLLDPLRSETLPAVATGDEASPIFIRDPLYGTRCSTIVAIDTAGQGQIIERRFDATGQTTGDTLIDFRFPPAQSRARAIR